MQWLHQKSDQDSKIGGEREGPFSVIQNVAVMTRQLARSAS
jgi:hypothetical protein